MSETGLLISNWTETAFYYLASWFGVHDWIIMLKNFVIVIIHVLDWLAYVLYTYLHALFSGIF